MAAQTDIEVARQTYAVPAAEKTKQDQEKTKRTGIESGCRLAIATALIYVASQKITDNKWLAIALVGIAAIFGGKPLIDAIFKKGD
jgi:hypothetical protein